MWCGRGVNVNKQAKHMLKCSREIWVQQSESREHWGGNKELLFSIWLPLKQKSTYRDLKSRIFQLEEKAYTKALRKDHSLGVQRTSTRSTWWDRRMKWKYRGRWNQGGRWELAACRSCRTMFFTDRTVSVSVSEVWSHWTLMNKAVTGYSLTFYMVTVLSVLKRGCMSQSSESRGKAEMRDDGDWDNLLSVEVIHPALDVFRRKC